MLFDASPALQCSIESLLSHEAQNNAVNGELKDQFPPNAAAEIVRIAPRDAFAGALTREADSSRVAGNAGQSRPAIAELLLAIPGLLSSDLVYVADPIALVDAAIEAGSAIPDSAEEKAGEKFPSNPERIPEPGKLALTVLALLRDRVRGAIYVTCPDRGSPMPARNDFFALGYRHVSSETNQPAALDELYFYSLREYKQVPGWLNSRYWANPERWDIED